MAIKLDPDRKQRCIGSIKRYFTEQLDDDIGELKAGLLLEFVLREISPIVYNQAIIDAQVVLRERVDDLDGNLYEPEFEYWKDSGGEPDTK